MDWFQGTNSLNSKIKDKDVQQFFEKCPKEYRSKLLNLRQLIIETASTIKEVNDLSESLKWGEPSFVPSKANIGSPIRLNKIKSSNQYAIFFNCQSNLVPLFKQLYPDTFKFGGNRSIIFELNEKIPRQELQHCISLALTYHLNKNKIAPIN